MVPKTPHNAQGDAVQAEWKCPTSKAEALHLLSPLIKLSQSVELFGFTAFF